MSKKKKRDLSFNEILAIAPILGGILAKNIGAWTPEKEVEKAIEYYRLLDKTKIEVEPD